jgi:hypothetical protein
MPCRPVTRTRTASPVTSTRSEARLAFRPAGAVPGGFAQPELGYVDLLILYRPL